MKGLKLTLFFLITSMMSQLAYAVDYNSCSIKKIGIYPAVADASYSRSGYPIFMACDGGTETMYFLSSDMGNAGLATALTAVALKQPVWARITSTPAGGLVTVMYLTSP